MEISIYYPGQSVLHRLDARIKVGGLLWLTLGMSGGSWLSLGVNTLGILFLSYLSGLPGKVYRSTLMALVGLGLFYGVAMGWVATGSWFFWRGYWSIPGLEEAGFMLWRIGLVFMLTRLFAAITPPLEQGMGITYFMTPFLKLTPKAADFMLLITLTLRFIPLLIEEGQFIGKARRLKGPWPRFFMHKIIAVARLVPPLVLLALRRAEEVSENLLARGYTSGHYRSIRYGDWKRSDSWGVFGVALWPLIVQGLGLVRF